MTVAIPPAPAVPTRQRIGDTILEVKRLKKFFPVRAGLFRHVIAAFDGLLIVHAGGPGSSGRFGDAAHTFFPLRLNIV